MSKTGSVSQMKNNWYSGTYSNYSKNVDDALKKAYEKYGNTQYWEQFENIATRNMPDYINPDTFNNNNIEYYRDVYNNWENTALSDISQLYGVIREEEYNSSSQQAARERAAGLNPDLLGNVDSGQAAEFDDAASHMDIPSAVAAETARVQNISSIAQAGMTFVEQFVGLADQFIGMRQGMLSNSALEFDLSNNANEYAQDWLAQHMKVDSKGQISINGQVADDLSAVPDMLIEAFKEDSDNMPFGRVTKKLMKRAFKSWNKDDIAVSDKIEKLFNSFASNRFQRTKLMSSPLWNDDAGKMLSNVVDGFGNIDYEVWKIQQEVQKEVLEFNKTYYSNANANGVPDTQASLDFQQGQNALQYEQAVDAYGLPDERAKTEKGSLSVQQLQNSIDEKRLRAIDTAEKEFQKIYDNLKGDKWYHVLGRLLIPVLRSLVTNGVNRYFDAAAASLGNRTFERPSSPTIQNRSYTTNNYN